MSKGLSGKAAIVVMIAVLLVMGVAGWAVLRYLLPQYWFEAYPCIPLTFMIFSVIIVLLSKRWEKGVRIGRTTQQRVAINLMGAKMGKLLLSAILIMLYVYLGGEQVKPFLLTFAIFYTAFLVMDTLLFVSFTKKYNEKG